MKKFNYESGFAAAEALLIVVIVAIVGGTGWYVWHSKQSVNTTLSNTGKSDTPIVHKTTVSKDNNKMSSNAAEDASQYVTIADWGIRIKMRNADKIQFKVIDTPGQISYDGTNYDAVANPEFVPSALVNKSCEPGVSLFRAKEAPQEYTAMQVGNLYYWVTGGPGACDNDNDNQLKTQFLQDFSPKNISLLPQTEQ